MTCLDRFKRLRPYLYHLTASANLNSIRQTKKLYSAKKIAIICSGEDISQKRSSLKTVSSSSQSFILRDQNPLHDGNISYEAGWDFERFINELNRHVFFWPGSPTEPIQMGRNHFQRYAQENPVILRFISDDLFDKNPDPKFCKYNSGAPRCTNGLGSPRGINTFQPASTSQLSPGQVKEVVFEDEVILPQIAEFKLFNSLNWTSIQL